MAKPSSSQSSSLEDLRIEVILTMNGMEVWSQYELSSLYLVQLGVLRRNATQRHGVTRFRRGRGSVSYTHLTLPTKDSV